MRREDISKTYLPEDYFEGKDGTNYRFTILKDVAVAGNAEPIPYQDSHQGDILGLYDKYKDFTLYVHFPWCVEHCSYCHYYRGPVLKREELERMLAAQRKLALMMDEWIDLKNRNINSIYFGGGTPTVIPGNLLEEALEFWVGRYGHNSNCEVCVEASVVTLRDKKIDILEKFVNRLSIGIQSFDDRVLKVVERKHTSAQAKEVLKRVVPRFPSVNVDLIYGLYEQSLGDWLATVETAIELGAQSLTIYRLDIRDVPAIIKTFRKEPEKFPDEYICWRMYNEAKLMLEDAGYRENLIGWFLLPQVQDTTVYRERWEKQSPCIALGPGLHNYAADHFYETHPKHDDYIAAVQAGKLPVKHFYDLTPKKQLVWYVLAQLKSNSPAYKSVMKQRFGEDLMAWFMAFARNYIKWGVLAESEDKIQLTQDYHYILEWLLVELIGSI
jgi:oxygen-independent coproporphyrinogen-3 oxidase